MTCLNALDKVVLIDSDWVTVGSSSLLHSVGLFSGSS